MSQASTAKLPVNHLAMPLEVHFYPQHGSYDTRSILPSGAPTFRSGVQNRYWSADPDGDWDAESEIDPWRVRDRILQDDCDWDDFCYQFGRFGHAYDLLVSKRWYKGTEASADLALSEDFREWRTLLHKALRLPMAKWRTLESRFPTRKVQMLLRPPEFTLRWRGAKPIAVLMAHTALDAILISVYLDKLAGVKFQACALCGKIFRVKTGHARKFCNHRCAHYVAVKASRARAARMKKAR